MKVGLILPLFSGDPERVVSFARRAEELGYDGVFAFDHDDLETGRLGALHGPPRTGGIRFDREYA